jgi:hypothetical protein
MKLLEKVGLIAILLSAVSSQTIISYFDPIVESSVKTYNFLIDATSNAVGTQQTDASSSNFLDTNIQLNNYGQTIEINAQNASCWTVGNKTFTPDGSPTANLVALGVSAPQGSFVALLGDSITFIGMHRIFHAFDSGTLKLGFWSPPSTRNGGYCSVSVTVTSSMDSKPPYDSLYVSALNGVNNPKFASNFSRTNPNGTIVLESIFEGDFSMILNASFELWIEKWRFGYSYGDTDFLTGQGVENMKATSLSLTFSGSNASVYPFPALNQNSASLFFMANYTDATSVQGDALVFYRIVELSSNPTLWKTSNPIGIVSSNHSLQLISH